MSRITVTCLSISMLSINLKPTCPLFVFQVTVNSQSARGTGPNKKLAKRAAAEVLLQILGYSRPSPQPAKPALKGAASTESINAADSEGGKKKVSCQRISL